MKMKIISISLLVLFTLNACSNSNNDNNTLTIKDAYKNKFHVGSSINWFQLAGRDSIAKEIIEEDFNTITPENLMKWERIHPQPDSFNFAPADQYVEFGQKNNMFIVGHTLVWHSQTPKWVFEHSDGTPLTRDELLERMHNHINTVVTRYKGKIHGWDVVNEAFEDDGSLRNSKWRQIIGDDFIELAFKFAKEADPDAELYYNDYNMYIPEKRKAVVELLSKIIANSGKVDGVGLQAHWYIGDPSAQVIRETINDYKTLGIKIMLTEMDLSVLPNPFNFKGADISARFKRTPESDPYTEGLPDSVAQKQADCYSEIFQILLDNTSVISRVTFWGAYDRISWKNGFPIRGRTDYPLLFDREGKPKKAYYALLDLVK